MTYYGTPTWRGPAPGYYTCESCGCDSPIGEPCWGCADERKRRAVDNKRKV